jgi:hypothetical protein
MSGAVVPATSTTAIPARDPPVAIDVVGPNENPVRSSLRRTEMVPVSFATATSRAPSPSRSATATRLGTKPSG